MSEQMTVKEIKMLFEAARKHGIGEFSIASPTGSVRFKLTSYTNSIDRPATAQEVKTAEQLAEEDLDRQVRKFKQDQLDEMALTDPLALENMIAQDLVEDIPDAQDSAQ
jgi:hypothetical protein